MEELFVARHVRKVRERQREAHGKAKTDPRSAAHVARFLIEEIALQLHLREVGATKERKLDRILQRLAQQQVVPEWELVQFGTVQRQGNYWVHPQLEGREPSSDDLASLLSSLDHLVRWYLLEYIGADEAPSTGTCATSTLRSPADEPSSDAWPGAEGLATVVDNSSLWRRTDASSATAVRQALLDLATRVERERQATAEQVAAELIPDPWLDTQRVLRTVGAIELLMGARAEDELDPMEVAALLAAPLLHELAVDAVHRRRFASDMPAVLEGHGDGAMERALRRASDTDVKVALASLLVQQRIVRLAADWPHLERESQLTQSPLAPLWTVVTPNELAESVSGVPAPYDLVGRRFGSRSVSVIDDDEHERRLRERLLAVTLGLAGTMALSERAWTADVSLALESDNPLLPSHWRTFRDTAAWRYHNDGLELEGEAAHAAIVRHSDEVVARVSRSLSAWWATKNSHRARPVPVAVARCRVRPSAGVRSTARPFDPRVRALHIGGATAVDVLRELRWGATALGEALYLNALDACRRRAAVAAESGEEGFEGRVTITFRREESGCYLECHDNGVGMSLADFEACFVPPGGSWWKTESGRRSMARWSRQGSSFRPTGGRGLGTLRLFASSVELEVESSPADGGPGFVALCSSHGQIISVSPPSSDAAGTRIRLRLEPELDEFSLEDRIVVSDLAVEVDIDGTEYRYEPGVPHKTVVANGCDSSFWWVQEEGAVLEDGIVQRVCCQGIVINLSRGETLSDEELERRAIDAAPRLAARGWAWLPALRAFERWSLPLALAVFDAMSSHTDDVKLRLDRGRAMSFRRFGFSVLDLDFRTPERENTTLVMGGVGRAQAPEHRHFLARLVEQRQRVQRFNDADALVSALRPGDAVLLTRDLDGCEPPVGGTVSMKHILEGSQRVGIAPARVVERLNRVAQDAITLPPIRWNSLPEVPLTEKEAELLLADDVAPRVRAILVAEAHGSNLADARDWLSEYTALGIELPELSEAQGEVALSSASVRLLRAFHRARGYGAEELTAIDVFRWGIDESKALGEIGHVLNELGSAGCRVPVLLVDADPSLTLDIPGAGEFFDAESGRVAVSADVLSALAHGEFLEVVVDSMVDSMRRMVEAGKSLGLSVPAPQEVEALSSFGADHALALSRDLDASFPWVVRPDAQHLFSTRCKLGGRFTTVVAELAAMGFVDAALAERVARLADIDMYLGPEAAPLARRGGAVAWRTLVHIAGRGEMTVGAVVQRLSPALEQLGLAWGFPEDQLEPLMNECPPPALCKLLDVMQQEGASAVEYFTDDPDALGEALELTHQYGLLPVTLVDAVLAGLSVEGGGGPPWRSDPVPVGRLLAVAAQSPTPVAEILAALELVGSEGNWPPPLPRDVLITGDVRDCIERLNLDVERLVAGPLVLALADVASRTFANDESLEEAVRTLSILGVLPDVDPLGLPTFPELCLVARDHDGCPPWNPELDIFNVLKFAADQGENLGTSVRRAVAWRRRGWAVSLPKEATVDLDLQIEHADLVLLSRDLDGVAPRWTASVTFDRLERAAAEVGRSPEETHRRLTQLAHLIPGGLEPLPADFGTPPELAVVELTIDGEVRGVFSLNKPVLTVGRNSENDIVVDHSAISRAHCKLIRDDGPGIHVVDNQSSNGIFIAGVQVWRHRVTWPTRIDLGGAATLRIDVGPTSNPTTT